MKLSERQTGILRHLNDCGDTSVQRLCDLTDVTAQTLRSELQHLSGHLEGSGVSISLLPGNIVHIEGAENLPAVLMEAQKGDILGADEQIELYLLLSCGFVTMQQLADSLHMSRSFAEKRIAALRHDGTFPIKAERRLGIRYDGTGYERVKCFLDLMFPCVPGISFLDELSGVEELGIPVLRGISRNRIEQAQRFAQELRTDRFESLTDDSYRRLLLATFFLLNDDAPGKGTDTREELSGPLTQLALLPDAARYRRRIDATCDELGMELASQQIDYLTGLMASLRKSHSLDVDEVSQDMDAFVLDILNRINDSLAVDLRSDRELRQGLSLHIYTTVIRRDAIDMVLEPYEEQEIRHQYHLGIEMASLAARAIEERYDYRLSETEIVYLALHFQVAIERLTESQRKVTAVVVCHYGQAAANLIAGKLERLFPLMDIRHVFSLQDYLACDETFDLVLATERVPETSAEVIYVSPALRGNEIERVRTFMNDRIADDMIAKRVREADVLDISGCKTSDEAVRTLVDHLSAMGAVAPEFYDTVVEREKISSTNMNHIAVPHGNPELIYESHLVIGRSRAGIPWGDSNVNCVFLFACSIDILREKTTVFSKFYRRLASLDKQGTIDELKEVPAELFRQQLAHTMTDGKERGDRC